MGKIYLLQVGDYFKIGYTKNDVNKRVKQLQTGNHEEITIRYVFETKFGMKVERALHNVLASKRTLGEFFDLDAKDVSNFMDLCYRYERAISITSKTYI